MRWEGKRALITGGAGFIGSHLAEELIKMNVDVNVLDVISEANAKNLSSLEGYNYIELDTANINDVKKLGTDFDFIFHLGAIAYPNTCELHPELAFQVNAQGTFNILNFALKNNLRKLVFTSSAQLYGKYPIYIPINEDHPINSVESVYNITKKIGEDLCTQFYDKYGLPLLILRFFNSFGPRQSLDYFMPTVITQALKHNVIEIWNEKPTRDFTYVKDTVNSLIKAAETSYMVGPINIGSGKEINVGQVAKHMAEEMGCELKVLNKDVVGAMRMCCDNSKAKRLLNWEAKVDFREGLKNTIDWYKNNR